MTTSSISDARIARRPFLSLQIRPAKFRNVPNARRYSLCRQSSEFGHTIPIPFTTPRLILRRLAGGDWKDLLEFMSDDELFRYSENSPLGEEQIIQWLEADSAVKLTTPGAASCLAIRLKAGRKVRG